MTDDPPALRAFQGVVRGILCGVLLWLMVLAALLLMAW
jgi:hypothetical protein